MTSANKIYPHQYEVNEAWLIFRHDSFMTIKNQGSIDFYFLMDVASCYLFGQVPILGERPEAKEVDKLFEYARMKKNQWPSRLLIPKGDPSEELFIETAVNRGIKHEVLPAPYFDPLTRPVRESFDEFFSGKQRRGADSDEVSARNLIPQSYDPCSCASGQKFKFCCKPIFQEIIHAMCAAEEGHIDVALSWLDKAKAKVGETAEVLCRYAIVLSYRSQEEFLAYLNRCLQKGDQPRAHYLLGLHYKALGQSDLAIGSYKKAIEFYPSSDKYHLNEAWNNLGSVYFSIADYPSAKGAWEKALTYLPTDATSRDNLLNFIYDNDELDEDLRRPSPFVERLMK